MSNLFKALPLLAILAASPALAADPAEHKDHHPAVAAEPADKSAAMARMAEMCPKMTGQGAGGQGMMMQHDAKPGQKGEPGMGSGGMMKGQDMHCRHGAPPASDAAPSPAPPPK